MNIFITGGTGFIGSHLRPLLLREGHYLTIVSRSPEKYESESAKNQQFIGWDADLVNAMEESDVVINMAGYSIFGERWTDEVKKKIYDSRIRSTRNIVKAIQRADDPPELMISASAAGYYGNRGDDWLNESAGAGQDFLAQVCVDWEAEAEKVEASGVRLAIPRFGIVLGKEGGALKQMLTPFKFFVGGPIGTGRQFVPWIHIRDLCRGIVYAIEEGDFEGAYNLNAPHPVIMNEFANKLATELNRPDFFRVPEVALKIMLGEAANPMINSLRLQPAKLQQAGFEFRFQYLEEALREIL